MFPLRSRVVVLFLCLRTPELAHAATTILVHSPNTNSGIERLGCDEGVLYPGSCDVCLKI